MKPLITGDRLYLPYPIPWEYRWEKAMEPLIVRDRLYLTQKGNAVALLGSE